MNFLGNALNAVQENARKVVEEGRNLLEEVDSNAESFLSQNPEDGGEFDQQDEDAQQQQQGSWGDPDLDVLGDDDDDDDNDDGGQDVGGGTQGAQVDESEYDVDEHASVPNDLGDDGHDQPQGEGGGISIGLSGISNFLDRAINSLDVAPRLDDEEDADLLQEKVHILLEEKESLSLRLRESDDSVVRLEAQVAELARELESRDTALEEVKAHLSDARKVRSSSLGSGDTEPFHVTNTQDVIMKATRMADLDVAKAMVQVEEEWKERMRNNSTELENTIDVYEMQIAELNTQLRDALERCSALESEYMAVREEDQAKLEALEQQLQTSVDFCKTAELKMDEFKLDAERQVEDANLRAGAIQAELDSTKEQLASFSTEKDQMAAELDAQRAKVSELQAAVDCDDADARHSEQKAQVDSLIAQVQGLSEEVATKQRAVSMDDAAMRDIQQELATLKSEHDQLLAQRSTEVEMLDAKVAEHKARVVELEVVLQEWQSKQVELDAAQAQVDELRIANAAHLADHQLLLQELEALKQTNSTLEAERHSIQADQPSGDQVEHQPSNDQVQPEPSNDQTDNQPPNDQVQHQPPSDISNQGESQTCDECAASQAKLQDTNSELEQLRHIVECQNQTCVDLEAARSNLEAQVQTLEEALETEKQQLAHAITSAESTAATSVAANARLEEQLGHLETSQQQLAEAMETIETLQQQLVDSRAQADEGMGNQIEQLRGELERLVAENTVLRTEVESSNANETLERQYADLQAAIEERDQQHQEYERQISELESSLASAENQLEAFKSASVEETEQAQTQLEASRQDVAELQSQLGALEEKLVHSQTECTEAQNTAQALQAELESGRSVQNIGNATQDQVAQLEGELEAAVAAVGEKDQTLQEAVEEMERLRQAHEELQATLEANKSESEDVLVDLRHQVETLQCELGEKESRLGELAEALQTTNNSLGSAEMKAEDLQQQVAEQQGSIAEARLEVNRLTEALRSAQESVCVTEEKLEKMRASRDKDREVATNAMRNNSTWQTKVEALEHDVEVAVSERTQLAAQVEELNSANKELENSLSEMSQENERLVGESAKQQTAFKASMEDIEAAHATRVAELHTLAEKAVADAVSTLRDEHQREIKTIQQQVVDGSGVQAEFSKYKKRAQMALKKAQSDHADQLLQLEQQLAEVETKQSGQHQHLEQQLAAAEAKHASQLEQQLAAAEAKHADQLHRLQQQLAEAEAQHADTSNRLRDVEAQLDEQLRLAERTKQVEQPVSSGSSQSAHEQASSSHVAEVEARARTLESNLQNLAAESQAEIGQLRASLDASEAHVRQLQLAMETERQGFQGRVDALDTEKRANEKRLGQEVERIKAEGMAAVNAWKSKFHETLAKHKAQLQQVTVQQQQPGQESTKAGVAISDSATEIAKMRAEFERSLQENNRRWESQVENMRSKYEANIMTSEPESAALKTRGAKKATEGDDLESGQLLPVTSDLSKKKPRALAMVTFPRIVQRKEATAAAVYTALVHIYLFFLWATC